MADASDQWPRSRGRAPAVERSAAVVGLSAGTRTVCVWWSGRVNVRRAHSVAAACRSSGRGAGGTCRHRASGLHARGPA